MTTPAGWYPDPYDASLLRYWDGAVWTDSVSPVVAPVGPGEPYGAAPGGYGPPYGGHHDGAGYGDVGHWLSATFGRVGDRIAPMAVLLFVVPVVAWIVVAVLGRSLAARITIDDLDGTPTVSGFEPGLLVAVVLVAALALIIGAVCWLAANHQMYAAHAGEPQSLGDSLAVGLRRFPRAIGWGLILVLLLAVVLVAVVLVPAAVIAATSTGDDVGLALGVIFVLGWILLAVVLGVWLWVRLVYFGVAVAVAPSGTNPLSASWSLTRQRWWSTFGRLILLVLILGLISITFNVVSQVAFGAATATIVEVDPDTGELLIDGQSIEALDELVLDEYLPAAPVFALIIAFSTVGQAVNQALGISAISGLYHRIGGPGEI